MSALILLDARATCSCLKFDTLDSYLRESDLLVAKAVSVSEVAQIARIEVRTRKALSLKWNARAAQASKSAGAVYKSGGGLKAAFAAADKAMRQWEGDVSAGYSRNLEDAYKLARRAGFNRASGRSNASLQYTVPSVVTKAKGGDIRSGVKLTFNAKDERAIDQLQTQQLWWIGDTYDKVAPTIRTAIEPKVLAGLSQKRGGEMVEAAISEALDDFRIPDGFRGPSERYFEGLAANAVTSARVGGQLTSFAQLGVVTYELINPNDERTSDICAELNGTTFEVAQAEKQMGKLAGARTPEAFKAIKPWLSVSKILSLSAKGSGALAAAGQMFPPFHFRCRTTVDIADGTTFETLVE